MLWNLWYRAGFRGNTCLCSEEHLLVPFEAWGQNHLKPPLLTCLLGWEDASSCERNRCGVSLHVLSNMPSRISYRSPQGSQESLPGGSHITFYDPASNTMRNQYCHSLLVKAVPRIWPSSRERDIDICPPHPPHLAPWRHVTSSS